MKRFDASKLTSEADYSKFLIKTGFRADSDVGRLLRLDFDSWVGIFLTSEIYRRAG
jgi:hypothetical protein